MRLFSPDASTRQLSSAWFAQEAPVKGIGCLAPLIEQMSKWIVERSSFALLV